MNEEKETQIPAGSDQFPEKETNPRSALSEFDWKRISIILTLMIGVSSLIASLITGGLGFIVNDYYKDQVGKLDVTRIACESSVTRMDRSLEECDSALDAVAETLSAPTNTPWVVTSTPEAAIPIPVASPTQLDLDAAMQNIVESIFAEASTGLILGKDRSLIYPSGSLSPPAYSALSSFWRELSSSFDIDYASWRFDPIYGSHLIEEFRFSANSHSMWADACLHFGGFVYCGEAESPEEFEAEYCLNRFNIIVSEEKEGDWYVATWTSRYDLSPLIEDVKSTACDK